MTRAVSLTGILETAVMLYSCSTLLHSQGRTGGYNWKMSSLCAAHAGMIMLAVLQGILHLLLGSFLPQEPFLPSGVP